MKKTKYLLALLSILSALLANQLLAQTAEEVDQGGSNPAPATTNVAPGMSAPVTEPTTTELKGDYTQLQQYLDKEYLQQNGWESADQETYKMMLKVAGQVSEEQGRFNLTEWQNFPCADLKEIDRLWSQASNGQLGFKAQKNILEQAQGNFYIFYGQIGWFDLLTKSWKVAWNYNPEAREIDYLEGKRPNFTNPPAGHLPAKLAWEGAEGENSVDRRFDKIYTCPGF